MNFKSFSNNELGATMLEYALLGALILVVAAVAVGTVGRETAELFTDPKMEDAFSANP